MKKKTNTNILKKCEANHIWLNAFSCINPDDKLLKDIGMTIIRMLNDNENLLRDENSLSNQLYLRINKS